MKKAYIVVLDAGSSNIKAAIYDSDGECVAASSEKSPREPSSPGLSNAQDYYDAAIHCLKDVTESAHIEKTSIEAIVFTGQMAGAVGVDKHFNAVTLWSGTLDTDHIPYFLAMPEVYQSSLLVVSGTNASFMLPKIKWMQEAYSGSFKKIEKFMILSNFIAGKMAGIEIQDAFIDRTMLEWTGGADIKNDCWSDLLCSAAEVDIRLLPRIVHSSSVIGSLSKETAHCCGLPSGIPLIAGSGDKPAGCIGAGVVSPGQMIDETSTVGAISQCLDAFIPDTKHKMLEIIPSPIPGQYYSLVYFVGSGTTVEWFVQQMCSKEADDKSGSAYRRIEEEAAILPPGSQGLLAIGMFNGRALPMDPAIRGLWMGHTWTHRLQHFYRALLESFGYEYACALRVMQETYPNLKADEIRVIGGGSTSNLYNQIKADILGKKYVQLNRDDLTMLGTAIIGGYAVGIFKEIKETAQRLAGTEKITIPNLKNTERYEKYVKLYESSFCALRPLYEELNSLRSSLD